MSEPESSVGKKVVTLSGKVGTVTQEDAIGAYVRFPDGNEDYFLKEQLKLAKDPS
jgi:hypothetical protein